MRPPPKARVALVAYVLEGVRAEWGHNLAAELASWATMRGQFEGFLTAHRDKVRKKLRSAGDDDAMRDVRAELVVASLLCRDRRFAVAFEAYGQGKRGPDLTVLFRQTLRFNVEVTRVRPGGAPTAGVASRLQGVLLAKLRQLPTGVPNVLALVTGEGIAVTVDDVASAARQLKQRADRKEEAVFARRGYESVRAFLGYLGRLSGVLVVTDASADASTEGSFWSNALATHPLPRTGVNALVGCASSEV